MEATQVTQAIHKLVTRTWGAIHKWRVDIHIWVIHKWVDIIHTIITTTITHIKVILEATNNRGAIHQQVTNIRNQVTSIRKWDTHKQVIHNLVILVPKKIKNKFLKNNCLLFNRQLFLF